MYVHWILRSIAGRLSQVKTFFLAMLSLKIDFSKKDGLKDVQVEAAGVAGSINHLQLSLKQLTIVVQVYRKYY